MGEKSRFRKWLLGEGPSQDLTPHRQAAAGGATAAELAQLSDVIGFSISRDSRGELQLIPKSLDSSDVKTLWTQVSSFDQNAYASTLNRANRLMTYARMDASGAEGAIVLDTIADETLNITDRTLESLNIEISDKDIEQKVREVLIQNDVLNSARQDIRSMCKWGDGIYAVLPRDGTELLRLDENTVKSGTQVEKPVRPEDIVVRWLEGDQYELRGIGNRVFECKITRDDSVSTILRGDPLRENDKLQPYQFALFSIKDRSTFPYGLSRLERMRTTFEKLLVVENLLAVTRANKMDRIAIRVPDTGSADPATALTKLSHMKNMLKTLILGSSVSGYGSDRVTRNQDIALTEYLFIPENFKAEKLSTSLDFGSTDDAEFFRDKMITCSGLAKGYFLADGTDTRPGTLRQQDVKFARSLIPVGEAYCEGLKRLILLLAFYLGADISTLAIKVTIKKPAFISEDLLNLYKNSLDAVDAYIELMKKIHGDDYKVTGDVLKRIIGKLDAPEDLFFDEEGETKDQPGRAPLMDAMVAKTEGYHSLMEACSV